MVVAVMEVVLASPDDLHRLPVHRLGQHRRLDPVVGLGLAPEPASEQGHVDGHVLRVHAQPLRDQVARGLGGLEAAPYLALPLSDAGGGGRRLHGRVREVGDVVLRLDLLGGAGHDRGDVAVVADRRARLPRGLLERRLVRRGVVVRVRAVVPADLQRIPALHGRPGVLPDDRDAAQRVEVGRAGGALDRHHAHDAGHLERVGVVEARDLPAVDGWPRDDGVEHAVEPRVLAVLRLAGRDVAGVDQLQLALADVAELGRVLQAQGLARRDRLLGGGLGQRPVAELPAGRLVHDLVVLRLDLGHRHLPLRGGRGLEHRARRGAAATHGVEEVPGAARAVGVLVAVLLLVAGRLRDLDALPVGFELLGHDHRHAGAHALAHLGAVADDGDRAVVRDGDEGERVVDPAVGHAVRPVLRRVGRAGGSGVTDGEHEAAQGGHALEEAAAAHVGDDDRRGGRPVALGIRVPTGHRNHDFAPCRLAACLIAVRMRG